MPRTMTWVITRMCRECVDQSCVDVCPVECIYAFKGTDTVAFPNQLYIDPEECIDCGACEPECPWEAIFEDVSVPSVFQEDTALNAAIRESKEDFIVPEHEPKDAPTPDAVEENKRKWGLGA